MNTSCGCECGGVRLEVKGVRSVFILHPHRRLQLRHAPQILLILSRERSWTARGVGPRHVPPAHRIPVVAAERLTGGTKTRAFPWMCGALFFGMCGVYEMQGPTMQWWLWPRADGVVKPGGGGLWQYGELGENTADFVASPHVGPFEALDMVKLLYSTSSGKRGCPLIW